VHGFGDLFRLRALFLELVALDRDADPGVTGELHRHRARRVLKPVHATKIDLLRVRGDPLADIRAGHGRCAVRGGQGGDTCVAVGARVLAVADLAQCGQRGLVEDRAGVDGAHRCPLIRRRGRVAAGLRLVVGRTTASYEEQGDNHAVQSNPHTP
jgi:hypothetical protein